MGHRRRAATVLALLTTSCATFDGNPCPDRPGGWCDETARAVGSGWQYAQMSQNAYEDKDDYTLPGNIVTRFVSRNDATGFAYAVFDRFEDGEPTEVIAAFRGTEFSKPSDWLFGNLTGRQNRRGLIVVKALRKQLDDAGLFDVPISVTGHSLGGGISHYVSQRAIGRERQQVVLRSVVFNNSPVYWRPAKGPDSPPERASVDRLAFTEWGELLSLLRGPAPEAHQYYTEMNCHPGFHPIKDHKIRRLADCMTWIAAFADPEVALLSLSENPDIAMPPSQTAPDQPPGLPQGRRARPVNLFAPGGDYTDPLFNAVIAEFASSRFEPRFGSYAGLQLRIERKDPTALRYRVEWQRNWFMLEEVDLDCVGDGGAAQCARKLVEIAEQRFPEKKAD
jgi:hypothetical protein